jgi:hypothetical protein
MSIARETDATLVKPLEGAILRRKTTGAAVEAGEVVYLDSSGYIQPTDATAVATNFVYGVAVQDIASGDSGPVVVFGPILCMSGATPGGIVYTMDTTAGEFDQTGGTKTSVVGVAETATILFVNPWMVSFS